MPRSRRARRPRTAGRPAPRGRARPARLARVGQPPPAIACGGCRRTAARVALGEVAPRRVAAVHVEPARGRPLRVGWFTPIGSERSRRQRFGGCRSARARRVVSAAALLEAADHVDEAADARGRDLGALQRRRARARATRRRRCRGRAGASGSSRSNASATATTAAGEERREHQRQARAAHGSARGAPAPGSARRGSWSARAARPPPSRSPSRRPRARARRTRPGASSAPRAGGRAWGAGTGPRSAPARRARAGCRRRRAALPWSRRGPVIRPDLVTTSSPPISFALRSTRQERRNCEPRRASGYSRGTVSTLWLNTSGRSAITRASGISSPRKSGVSTSTLRAGREAADRADHADEGGGAEVGQVVAVDAGDHGVAQAHALDRLGHAQRLERVVVRRLAGLHVAEPAPARARVAEDHERGRAALPAVADVRAGRLLADRVQPLLVHHPAQLAVLGAAGGGHLEPRRLALAERAARRPSRGCARRRGWPGSGSSARRSRRDRL